MAPTADLVTAAAGNISTPFSENQQNLTLTATVTDATNSSTVVNEGTVAFTVEDSSGNSIGTAQGTVSNGAANGSFTLPAAEMNGNYTILVSYSDNQGNFTDDGTDTPGTLSVNPTSVLVAANDASATFSTADQSVNLTASVTDPNDSQDIVNEGTVDFTVKDGSGNQIGTAQGTVSNGTATGSFTLPGSTAAGPYTIAVIYSDSTGNFTDDGTDTPAKLTVSPASVLVAANDASATFSTADQSVTLTASVTNDSFPSDTVSEGTVQFTVKDSNGNQIGTAQGTVSNGTANASFTLPGSEAAGQYTIAVAYSDTSGNFSDNGTDTSAKLTVSPASVKVVGGNSSAAFSTSSQPVTLTASVTDNSTPSDTVSEGTVTFTVKNSNGVVVGSPVQGTVTGGKASATFTVPAHLASGSYTIAVAYSDASSNFSDDGTDTSGKLTVGAASTTIQAGNAAADFSTGAQNVKLTATVTSGTQKVNEGSVTFSLVDSKGKIIGKATTSAVTNGSASVSYSLPAGTAVGSYTIEAVYNDSANNFSSSFDNTHTLKVNIANSTSLSLTTANINPSLVNGTAQVTLTAKVSNAGGTVNEGVLSFSVAGVSSQANVVNGTASVQLTVPLQSVTGGLKVALSYTDSGKSASFGDSQATVSVSTSIWNALLPASLTFDSNNTETMQFTVANQPLFGASYSLSTGLLSEVSLSSLSMPVTYMTTGDSMVASVGGVPWGMILFNTHGQFVGTASVTLTAGGTPMWILFDVDGRPAGELPYGS